MGFESAFRLCRRGIGTECKMLRVEIRESVMTKGGCDPDERVMVKIDGRRGRRGPVAGTARTEGSHRCLTAVDQGEGDFPLDQGCGMQPDKDAKAASEMRMRNCWSVGKF